MVALPHRLKLSDGHLFSPLSSGSLKSEGSYDQVLIREMDISSYSYPNLSFDEAVFEKVVFVDAQLDKLQLCDVKLRTSDLSAAHCSESSFIRVECTGGRMSGIDVSRSTLKDVVFKDCKLAMANLRYAKLTRVRFVDCLLTEADFQGAQLQDVVMQGCTLERTEFGKCAIKRVDLRASQLIDIGGWQWLKGATIDNAQLFAIAPQLARQLGLIVSESDS